MTTPPFLTGPPRFLFFTGKGGVGKTSMACAAAVQLAGEGKRVLLVSTDPASNVGQVFGVTIGNSITAIAAVPRLWALEIDPQQAADAYRARIIDPVRGLLPAPEVDAMTEQLSGACTTEIASFNEFTSLLADPETTSGYDHVLFDTAPTGHTIRLLQLPGEWTAYLSDGKGDVSCLGPVAGLDRLRHDYRGALDALSDPTRTRLVLVSRPQRSSLDEAARTYGELLELGMSDAHLVINGEMTHDVAGDPLAAAVEARESDALEALPGNLRPLPRTTIPLLPFNTVGLAALGSLFERTAPPLPDISGSPIATVPDRFADLRSLVDTIEVDGPSLVMCMGKGGVGKTTVAAAVALELARRGHEVLLSTTDPAAHLTETLQADVEHLTVSRIDPVHAITEYRERVMAGKGGALDDAGRAVLAEDLKSPCTDEVAVFRQFSHVVFQSRRMFVVLDTAPTGHTLLLLDATGSYHREITRQMSEGTRFTTPLMRLQDPHQTKVLLITLPETTPVQEAEGLQGDLARAGITPFAWVVNNSLAAASPSSAFLKARARAELPSLARVMVLCDRVAIVPMLAREPMGTAALSALIQQPGAQAQLASDVREQVRAHYARAARALADPAGRKTLSVGDAAQCCTTAADATAGSSCCSGAAKVRPAFGASLYSAGEHGELPVAAVTASLGCGNPVLVAELRDGETVLDLGSGGGIDVLLAARRVGQLGFVYGIDMTDEMLDLARRNADAAAIANVKFLKGVIENLPLPDDAVDVVISNCVINLSTDKAAVLAEMYRVLRPGGRIGISDIVADDHLAPQERAERGSFEGCFAGALSRQEYLDGLADSGFTGGQVTFTHQAADGMHGALIRATKPA